MANDNRFSNLFEPKILQCIFNNVAIKNPTLNLVLHYNLKYPLHSGL